jgi:hypothetical protein
LPRDRKEAADEIAWDRPNKTSADIREGSGVCPT